MYSEEIKSDIISTVIGGLDSYPEAEWLKLKDLAGRYEKGILKVKGFFYRKNAYAKDAKGLDSLDMHLVLYNEGIDAVYFVKMPSNLKKKIANDWAQFKDKIGLNIEDYLNNASIKCIKKFKTKFGTESANYQLW